MVKSLRPARRRFPPLLAALAAGWLATALLGGPLLAAPKRGSVDGGEPSGFRLVEQAPKPAGGMFLVAARGMLDPHFTESVVLLVDHEAGGSWGLVINRPTTVKLSEMFQEESALGRRRENLFYGGPVEPTRILMLVRSPASLPDSRALFDDVRLAWSPEIFTKLADPLKAPLRVFAGYAGWAPGQLEAEIERRDWILLPAEAALVFSDHPETVWQTLQTRSPQPVAVAKLAES